MTLLLCARRWLYRLWFAIALSTANAADPSPEPSRFEGTWTWEFTMPDGAKISPTLRVHTDEDGIVSLKTRFRPGSSLAITNFSIQGNSLTLEVLRERNGATARTQYSGTLDGDTLRGTIVSDSSGTPAEYPWIARRNVNIEGSWKWTVRPFGRPGQRRDSSSDDDEEPSGVELQLSLKRDADKVSGKLKIGASTEVEIKHGRFRDGIVTFQTARERNGAMVTNNYLGKLNGDRLQGQVLTYPGGRARTNSWRALRVE
jgi:hypothetical protein